jgi:hypothetical protein
MAEVERNPDERSVTACLWLSKPQMALQRSAGFPAVGLNLWLNEAANAAEKANNSV